MLNYLWLCLVILAVLIGGITGRMKEVTEAAFTATTTAVVTIALPLAGLMTLWLGIMRLAERSGLIQILARALRPLMRRLFPDVPPDHPAMGSMLMNMASNMLGLSNAATPLGLRAMRDLETLNKHPGTATNAMCTFLAINTSSIQLLPTTVIGILAVAKSAAPTAIVAPAMLASLCAATAGIITVKWLEKLPIFRIPNVSETTDPAKAGNATTETPVVELANPAPMPVWGHVVIALFVAFFAGLLIWQSQLPESFQGTVSGIRKSLFPNDPPFQLSTDFLNRSRTMRALETVSLLAVPFFLSFFPLYASLRRVKVYEEFVEGAKEGFHVAVRIIPFLVAILVAVGMFRGAGGIQGLQQILDPILVRLKFPPDLLPLVLVRPLSGSAAIGLFTELANRPGLGPDNIITRMAATICGSTETTFYVLAVYFGSVAVRRTRHALPAGLVADATGVIASIVICRLMFG